MMTMDEMVHGVVHGAGTAHADKHDDRRPDQIGSDLRLVPDFRSPIDSPARVARGRAVARAACRCRGHAGPLCACTWSARRAVYMSTILPTDYCTLGRVRLAPLVAHPRSAALRVRDSIEDCGVILPPESFLKHVHRGRGMIPSGDRRLGRTVRISDRSNQHRSSVFAQSHGPRHGNRHAHGTLLIAAMWQWASQCHWAMALAWPLRHRHRRSLGIAPISPRISRQMTAG